MRSNVELGEKTHLPNIGVYPLRKSTAFSGHMVFLLGKPGLELLGYMEVKEGPAKQLPLLAEVSTSVVCCHYMITLASREGHFPVFFHHV